MLVRSLQSYEETNHFLRAMFLGLVPALLDSNLYRIAINDTQKSMIPTSVHFCSGTCWHFSTGTSVHFSKGTFLHLISGTCRIRCESQSNERQITSNLHWCRLPWRRAAALLWNLLAGLKRHLVALGVSHLCRVNYNVYINGEIKSPTVVQTF